MSVPHRASKKSLFKKTLGWLFKPTIPVYEDGPKRVPKRKAAQADTSAGKSKKPQAVQKTVRQKPVRKSSSGKSKIPFQDLPLEEQGTRLGYIDKKGIVRMKADGRQVGRPEASQDNSNPGRILGAYIEKFRNLEAKVADLAANADRLTHSRFDEITALEETLKTDAGLGDPTAMLAQISTVKSTLKANINKLKSEKLKVLQQADKLPYIKDQGDVDWRASDAALARITAAWGKTGDIGAEAQSALDIRYQSTIENYRARKEKFFTDFQSNAYAKNKLLRRAQNLSQLRDTQNASDEFEILEKQWRSVGPAEAGEDAMLRAKFNIARKEFEDRNADTIAVLQDRKEQLAVKKAALIADVQALANINNPHTLSRSVRRYRDALSEIESVLGQDGETKVMDHQLANQSGRADELQKQAEAVLRQNARRSEEIQARLGLLAKAGEHGISWKDADLEIKELKEEAAALKNIPHETRRDLDQAFQDKRRDFIANRTAFFETMDAERATNAARKRALINDLPFYKNGITAAGLVARLNASMEAWKKTGPAERDENEALWQEYRQIRKTVFDKVDELRELEKDDFLARLAYTFEKKKEELYRLESEVNREAMLADESTDKEKARRLRSVVERKKLRISGMQKEILDIQRKLAKMSPVIKKPAQEAKQKEPPVSNETPKPTETGPTEAGQQKPAETPDKT